MGALTSRQSASVNLPAPLLLPAVYESPWFMISKVAVTTSWQVSLLKPDWILRSKCFSDDFDNLTEKGGWSSVQVSKKCIFINCPQEHSLLQTKLKPPKQASQNGQCSFPIVHCAYWQKEKKIKHTTRSLKINEQEIITEVIFLFSKRIFFLFFK